MIDLNKLRRFEEALAKHTNSKIVDQIYNELEPQIMGAIKHIEEQEALASEIAFRHSRYIELTQRTRKWIKSHRRSINMLRRYSDAN